MIQEGTLRELVVIDGVPRDEVRFALLKADWERQVQTGRRFAKEST